MCKNFTFKVFTHKNVCSIMSWSTQQNVEALKKSSTSTIYNFNVVLKCVNNSDSVTQKHTEHLILLLQSKFKCRTFPWKRAFLFYVMAEVENIKMLACMSKALQCQEWTSAQTSVSYFSQMLHTLLWFRPLWQQRESVEQAQRSSRRHKTLCNPVT